MLNLPSEVLLAESEPFVGGRAVVVGDAAGVVDGAGVEVVTEGEVEDVEGRGGAGVLDAGAGAAAAVVVDTMSEGRGLA